PARRVPPAAGRGRASGAARPPPPRLRGREAAVTAGPADPAMDGRVRRALLALFALGSLGTGVELLLLEHFEKPPQWTPLALLAIGVVLAAGQVRAASRAAVRLFQAVM